jgi:hypothetical protein
MSSFSCPHFDMQREYCFSLQTDCVPGRPGCLLSKNSVFAVPVEERIRCARDQNRTDSPSRGKSTNCPSR